jgi:hypothetical protein
LTLEYCAQQRSPGYLPQNGIIMQHIGIPGISQRAITFFVVNAAPNTVCLGAEPHFFEVVVCVPQIQHCIGANAARPHIAIGVNLRRSPPGVTIKHLGLFYQYFFHQIVILQSKRLRDVGNSRIFFSRHTPHQLIDDAIVVFRLRRNIQANSVQFNALFGNFGDKSAGRFGKSIVKNLNGVGDIEF